MKLPLLLESWLPDLRGSEGMIRPRSHSPSLDSISLCVGAATTSLKLLVL